jgi:hypothetical protein
MQELLLSNPDCMEERTSLDHTPLHLAASWPLGLRILLQAGSRELINVTDNVGFLPISYSVYHQCLEAVQLLADANSPLYSTAVGSNSTLHKNVVQDAMGSSTLQIVDYLLQHLCDRRRRLQLLAVQELSAHENGVTFPDDRVLDARAQVIHQRLIQHGTPVPASLRVPRGTVYESILYIWRTHRSIYRAIIAQKFYDAGFYDIDEYNTTGLTLLMRRWTTVNKDVVDRLLFFSWLIEKGARLDKFDMVDEGEHKPASHYLGEYLMHLLRPCDVLEQPHTFSFVPSIKTIWHLIHQVITELTCDSCVCACSSTGCVALTQMLKAIPNYRRTQNSLGEAIAKSAAIRLDFYCWLANTVSAPGMSRISLASTIIRFETFTRMELTHTCCKNVPFVYLYDTYFTAFNEDDRREIREEQGELIDELEKLVSEFQTKYTELEVSLPDFLNGYWSVRMDEVLNPTEPMDLEECARIRELGVVLNEFTEIESD